MRPIQRIRRRGLAEDIVEELTRRVVGGEWSPDSPLPSNRKLAEAFGVSTLTVREAVRALEARGLIESRHGAGTFVLAGGADDTLVPWMIRPVDVNEYRDLNEARRGLETQIVELAAARRTSADLARLRDAISRMTHARRDGRSFLEADLDFHIALADASGNRVLVRMLLAIRAPLKRLMSGRAIAEIERVGSLDVSIADHQSLLDGIERGDPAAGRVAISRMTDRAATFLEEIQPPGDQAGLERPG